ncbi:hypothetical protein LZL87_004592 [Fusarium oxysporum]|nr:hypothetical protein LZL87_004592 [Fusarium oxysporum]
MMILAAIIVALPIGRIADHRGQRGVFMVVVVGILMILTWTLIVSKYSTSLVLYSPLNWSCTEETRTRGLYYFYTCFIFGKLVGPPVASVAADILPWLPFLINYVLLLLTFSLLLTMPKDHIYPSLATIDSTEDPPTSHEHGHSILRAVLHASFDQIHLRRFMLPSHNMCLATNALISEVALVKSVLFFFIMPALLRIVSKYLKPTPQVLNLGTVRASLSLLFLGSFSLAFATNSAFLIAATMIYSLGFGGRSTLLSLVTSCIDPKRVGTLFSAAFLVE